MYLFKDFNDYFKTEKEIVKYFFKNSKRELLVKEGYLTSRLTIFENNGCTKNSYVRTNETYYGRPLSICYEFAEQKDQRGGVGRSSISPVEGEICYRSFYLNKRDDERAKLIVAQKHGIDPNTIKIVDEKIQLKLKMILTQKKVVLS